MTTQSPPSAKDAMRGFIEQHFDEQVHALARLVQCPSDNPPGDCTQHALVTAQWLTEMGFAVEQHEVPLALAQQHGMQSVTNLIVREKFGDGGPVVAMNAHGDVVPPGEGWSASPYSGEIRDGWLYGRGAAVSKSDFTTYAYALRALKSLSGVGLKGQVELHFTYDEETGGMTGPQWILQQGLSKPDYVLSAAFSHHVVTAHNGCLHLEITLRGRSAHAAWPDTGSDAIEASVPLLAALYRYRDGLADRPSSTPGITHPTLVVGLVKGGINTNVVPDVVTLRVDRRIVPEEVPEQVEAELREVIAASVQPLAGIQVEVTQILLARPFKPVAGAQALTDLVCREGSAVLGTPVTPIGVPLYTDARLYSEAGIPTVMYGAGPATLLAANGHRADERVPLLELQQATQVVANVLLELLTR
ncbi:acetylornithine deacetylase/succinyl-diaminopimelate desuccinylase-like protein [Rhodoferax ferrireducens]|uniref:Acetylornithine deacetylase/succinyl-diaminopimelate desuccinylase-like protein n=1 Tax=Rhodoferax ferrireducens TaxID=192843 RepID=A0ABU2C5A5_9BURK|nr:M20/M25/M40 family metallo-hydrolase [Rhodoferax ferrireducens]MDR7376524.1 acetylornithine deacetylase/succinyl-diaminopimelate desuccinylase-like protein [Rhodoferax ferrireducens]